MNAHDAFSAKSCHTDSTMCLRPAPATPQFQDWAHWRAAFPAALAWAYLDGARKGLLPKWSEDAITDWIADAHATAGKTSYAPHLVEDSRRDIARLLGTSPDEIAFVRNTADGINAVAQALHLQPGENVVVGEHEHESNVLPWKQLQHAGVEVRIARAARPGEPLQVADYTRCFDAHTRVVATSWVSCGLAYRTDVPALAKQARNCGILSVVDAIQAAGVLSTTWPELQADIIVAGGHKFLFGLAGLGILYIRHDIADRLEPLYAARGTYAADTEQDRFSKTGKYAAGARRFEYGNPNLLGASVLGCSARMLFRIGLPAIEARVRELSDYAFILACRRGLTVRTPRPWPERAGTLSLALPNAGPELVGRLREQGIICSLKEGHLRISAHFYNTQTDLDCFFEAVK